MLNKVPNLSYSVSFTTRAPRNGEVDGREYFFVTPEKFEQMVAANEFLEWAQVHCKFYGTGRQQVYHEISQGRDIILEVDVQGAASIRELMADSVRYSTGLVRRPRATPAAAERDRTKNWICVCAMLQLS